MKTLRKIIITLILFFFILCSIGILLAYLFEDKITAIVIQKINTNLKTEITAENVEFSLLKKFPYASIEFQNVLSRPSLSFNAQEFSFSCDTLFYAKTLFLELNMHDILKKKYIIRNIHFDEGKMNVLVDFEGNGNYKLWDSTGQKGNEGLVLNLQHIKITKTDIFYFNHKNNLYFDIYCKKADFGGNFSAKEFSLKANTNLYIHKIKTHRGKLLASRNTKLNFILDVKNKNYAITMGTLKIADMGFSISGKIDSKKYIDATIDGSNLNIRSFLSLLPDTYKKNIKNYTSKGDFYFSASIKGSLSAHSTPDFTAIFGISNGVISKKNSSISMTDVHLKGNYNSFDKGSKILEINEFNGMLGKSNLAGDIRIENMQSPRFTLHTNSSLDLKDIHTYFTFDTLRYIDGMATCNITISGQLQENGKITKKDILSFNSEGTVELHNLNFAVKGKQNRLKNISGKVQLAEDFTFNDMIFTTGGHQFRFEGKARNVYEYILLKDHVEIYNATLSASFLQLDSLLALSKKDTSMFLPAFFNRIYMHTDVCIKQLQKKNFSAQNISGHVTCKPNLLVINNVYMNAMEGSISGEGVFVQNSNHTLDVKMQITPVNINISQLFSSFNNFTQSELKTENINGLLTGNISFSGIWGSNKKIIKKSIASECNIQIVNGELINFKPMLNLSNFCEVSELMHIRFSNLANEIMIKDEKVIIPQMDIFSNAFNITASGIHYFNNTYEYKMKLLLSDVLFRKARKAKQENEEYVVFDDENEGRASLYFTIMGDGKQHKISYDRKTAIQEIRNDLKEEKIELKQILKEEFGWFKKDTILTITDEKESKSPVLIFEWEDKEDKKTKEDKKQNKPFQIEWEDE